MGGLSVAVLFWSPPQLVYQPGQEVRFGLGPGGVAQGIVTSELASLDEDAKLCSPRGKGFTLHK